MPGVRAKAQDDFAAIGLTLKSFYIGNLKPSEKSAEELRAMGMLDMQTYTQLQAADAMRDAAQNPSWWCRIDRRNRRRNGNWECPQPVSSRMAGAGAAGCIQTISGNGISNGIPDVMTPSEAAGILKVSEEDVLAAITAGDLKARKIGTAYRISREAVETFLKG